MTTSDGDPEEACPAARPGRRPTSRARVRVRRQNRSASGSGVVRCRRGRDPVRGAPNGRTCFRPPVRARGRRAVPSDGKPDDLLATAPIPRLGRGALIGAPPHPSERSAPGPASPWGSRDLGAIVHRHRGAGTAGRERCGGDSLATLSAPEPRALRARRRAPAWSTAGSRMDGPHFHRGSGTERSNSFSPAPAKRCWRCSSRSPATLAIANFGSSARSRARATWGSISVLERFGVVVMRSSTAAVPVVTRHVSPSVDLRAPTSPVRVEADASSAIVALAAGALSGGMPTVVRGVASTLRSQMRPFRA